MMKHFEYVVATQDWHPLNHASFASAYNGHSPMEIIEYRGSEQVLWVDHCVQGTNGAAFHPDLDINSASVIIRKGFRVDLDSYSAFLENDRVTPTGLHGYLSNLSINEVYVCGLATDYCVFYSAIDAIQLGYSVYLVEDACRGVGFPEGSIERAINEIKSKGGKIIQSGDILK